MNIRDVVIFTGKRFKVPQGIQRIDHRATHGWQLRYGGTKLFSDGSQDGSGAAASLKLATDELLKRIAKLPAPSRLQRTPSENKTTDLRAGAKVRECNLLVSLPRFGGVPRRSTIYIGNENTYTVQRYRQALARAIKLREEAEQTYQREATRAKRAGVQPLIDKQRSRRASS
jgi:hypothetical protein